MINHLLTTRDQGLLGRSRGRFLPVP